MRTEKLQKLQTVKTPATRKQHSAPKPAAARVVQAAKAAEILGRHLAATAPLVGRVRAKWRWHHKVLLSLLNRLSSERGDLRRAAAEPLEPHSLDEADSATDEFDHDLALTQLSADQDALCEVNEALKRIYDGSYGVCEETGKAIPLARLKAIPWTRFTYAVEERLEKKGVVLRAGLNKAASVRGSGQIRLASEEELEETEERPPVPANDEALSHVFSPPGRRIPLPKISKRSPKAPTPKGRRK